MDDIGECSTVRASRPCRGREHAAAQPEQCPPDLGVKWSCMRTRAFRARSALRIGGVGMRALVLRKPIGGRFAASGPCVQSRRPEPHRPPPKGPVPPEPEIPPPPPSAPPRPPQPTVPPPERPPGRPPGPPIPRTSPDARWRRARRRRLSTPVAAVAGHHRNLAVTRGKKILELRSAHSLRDLIRIVRRADPRALHVGWRQAVGQEDR